jgi:hypothetical protein
MRDTHGRRVQRQWLYRGLGTRRLDCINLAARTVADHLAVAPN